MLGLKEKSMEMFNEEDRKTQIFNKVLNDNIKEINEFTPEMYINTDNKVHHLAISDTENIRYAPIFRISDVQKSIDINVNESFEDKVTRCLTERMLRFICAKRR